jgi:CBS domain-containing protein
MQLKDVMTRRIAAVPPEATVQDDARKMEQLDIGPLPVCDSERLVGMVRDAEAGKRAARPGMGP